MPKRPDIALTAALDRLAKAEGALVGSQFLAPVLRGLGVGVRIVGVRCTLAVAPRDFEGWGAFEAVSYDRAKLVREMTMSERRRYLTLFPAVRMILCRRDGRHWLGLPASRADSRFAIEGLVPVRFVEEGEVFETVLARFDGGQFWFESVDDRADPAAAPLLRESLGGMIEPGAVRRLGLTAEQRAAYALEYCARLEAAEAAREAAEAEHQALLVDQRQATETRLRAALRHAGADLRDYAERGDVYRVSYQVDGRRHTSVVRKDDLTVVTAGVCLSGGDRHFDLASLVGVLREGEHAGRIVRTNWEV
jgi:hypothetical protein